MAIRKKAIWLSYDFGLKGNYHALFTFLDNHQAIDCGNNLAFFVYDNNDQLSSIKLIEKLKAELEETIKPTASDRIYVIWREEEESPKSTVKGKFLFGNRKQPSWSGYATKNVGKQEDEAI